MVLTQLTLEIRFLLLKTFTSSRKQVLKVEKSNQGGSWWSITCWNPPAPPLSLSSKTTTERGQGLVGAENPPFD